MDAGIIVAAQKVEHYEIAGYAIDDPKLLRFNGRVDSGVWHQVLGVAQIL